MNLYEALKSGKPFRRPDFPKGKWADGIRDEYPGHSNIGCILYTYKGKLISGINATATAWWGLDAMDLVAEDFELQEETQTYWLNVYSPNADGSLKYPAVHSSKEDADKLAGRSRIGCFPITFNSKGIVHDK